MKMYAFRFKDGGQHQHFAYETEEEAFLEFLKGHLKQGDIPTFEYDEGVPHFRHSSDIQLPDFFYWEIEDGHAKDQVGYTGYTLRKWLEKRFMKFTENKT
ncbi:hypothetical protein WELLINGTON_31 [Erwinia phage Wellington]|uniref:Uncharacterized protein n=2 Tax=Wellingtonvirus wellington TaxID=2734153 RepID=A0A1B2IDP3_9CAUD|nr:hypothetical protein BIZ80_gp268 [Erwinia phage vB_EamM_Kwan]YP_009806515.1 hypothetical protein HOT70_gp270 [Erwinia phage Wellington]ANZ49383.1 hypothetical protein KWAN_31 [Erwinia phage vB_EamM_Kwan]AXF51162.1 hypothetical protein WELLINGTON_31 [Erwinia phage Wellington]